MTEVELKLPSGETITLKAHPFKIVQNNGAPIHISASDDDSLRLLEEIKGGLFDKTYEDHKFAIQNRDNEGTI